MALIKCPECGKEISDKAESCPNCGYPINKFAPNIGDENVENTNKRDQEQMSVAYLEKSKKKSSRNIVIAAGILVGIGVICGAVILSNGSSEKVKISDGKWTYTENSDGKNYTDIVTVNSKKNFIVFTEDSDGFLIKDGKGTIKLHVENGEEKNTDKIIGIYEIKDEKDADIKIDTSKVKTEITEYESLGEKSVDLEEEIQTSYDKPFLLYYHFEDNEGNRIENKIINNDENHCKMITDSKTTITDYIWDVPLEDDTEYTFAIDGIVKFNVTDNFKANLGEFNEKINNDSDARYEARQKVTLESKESGILWCSITANDKDSKTQYCKVVDGEGELYWGDWDITEISDAPDLKYEFLWFAPSEYDTDFQIKVDENAEKKIPTLKEIGEMYPDDSSIKLGEDGSYLTVDTNPYDIEDNNNSYTWNDILDINKMLGLPDSVNAKMGSTRSMDGRISETYDNITVSWTYHPDNGLEVLYEEKK